MFHHSLEEPCFAEVSSDAALWKLKSAGRALHVLTEEPLDALWRQIEPHIPAVDLAVPPHRLADDAYHQALVRVPHGSSVGDLRRWLNAYIHCLHLSNNTLALHGVALERDGQAILLVGGHGSGKSLMGLALVRRGWNVLAGDVALVDLSSKGNHTGSAHPMLLGGTTAYLVRPEETLRCFPDLPIRDVGANRAELRHLLHYGQAAQLSTFANRQGWSLSAFVLVAGVTLDPHAEEAFISEIPDTQTVTTQLYRASGHLLDRVLEGCNYPLRQLETYTLACQRLELTRQLATSLSRWTVYGAPRRLATMIENVLRRYDVN